MQTCPHCHKTIIPNSFGWDAESRLIVRKGQVVQLTPLEGEFFDMLHRNMGRLVRRSRIVAKLYGLMDVDAENCLDVLVCKLRKKLPEGVVIHTMWNHGDEGGFWLEWS